MSKTSLKEIIISICDIYENLNQLADKKTQILKDNDIKSLDSIMQKEEVYNKKIIKLLQERDEYFAQNYEISKSEKEEVEKVAERLKLVSDEFSNKNELNQSLVQQSLYYVNLNLNMLAPQNDSENYSPQNKKTSRKPNRVFMDSRV